MHKRLPPLNALKAFESAARNLSFTKAADELFVTQAAVSHQIKSLERNVKRILNDLKRKVRKTKIRVTERHLDLLYQQRFLRIFVNL